MNKVTDGKLRLIFFYIHHQSIFEDSMVLSQDKEKIRKKGYAIFCHQTILKDELIKIVFCT